MRLIDIIRSAWGFTGLDPKSVRAINAFGNVIVEAADGAYWRICPEELSCERIAESAAELTRLRSGADFQEEWRMQHLAERATEMLGTPGEGRCFCLKRPAILGGAYDESNLGTIDISELLSSSGNIALQIEDLPDGSTVMIKPVD